MGVKTSKLTAFIAVTLCVASTDGSASQRPDLGANQARTGGAASPASFAYPRPDEVPTGTAMTFWASQPVDRNETVVVSGGNLNPTATVRLTRLDDGAVGSPLDVADSTNSGWINVVPSQATEQSLKFQLPDRARGVYAYRIVTGIGTGATTLVNAPDIWFVQGNVGGGASPGGRLNVFGTALGRMSASSQPVRIALVRNGSVQRILSADLSNPKEGMYVQSFAIPADVPQGDYELYLHNGSGGPSAWSRYQNFGSGPDRTAPRTTITSINIGYATNWPQTRCNVAPPIGNGASDDASFAAAFACAANAKGGVVSIPAGSYTLSGRGFDNIPNHTVIAGAGKQATVLNFPQVVGRKDAPAVIFKGGSTAYNQAKQPKCGRPINYAAGVYGIRDLSINAPNLREGSAILFEHMSVEDLHSIPFVRDSIITLGKSSDRTRTDPHTTGIKAMDTSNLQISGNDITSTKPIFMDSNVYGVTVQGNTLRWHETALAFNHDAQNALITHNRNISAGAPYYGTPSELQFSAPSRDVYYANNANQYPVDAEPPPWQLTMDEGTGNYFGKAAAVSGKQLTLARQAIDLAYRCNADGNSAMIVAGKGTGQQRYLTGNPLTLGNTVTLDSAWQIPPDQQSDVSIVTTNGRMLFVNNDYNGSGPVTNFYPSADVIHAYNRFNRFGGSLVQPNGFYTDAQALLPGWHSQMLNNEVTAEATTNPLSSQDSTATFTVHGGNRMISQGEDLQNRTYTGSVLSTAIIRNNRFATGASGSVGLWDRVSNSLLENNIVPAFRIQNENVKDSLIRANRTAGGGEPQRLINEPRPGNGNMLCTSTDASTCAALNR
ncbi:MULTISPECIES: hypothetical protein [Xanthomonas]|uniref:hypothetical protein n=1 Tax=Xanthomonas TaxID=338 RepID=UPI00129063DE|nr:MULTISPECIES: hypothetical protein [Xanthomonas]